MSSPTDAAPSPRIAWFALVLLLLSLSLFGYSLHLRSQDWAEARLAARPTVRVPVRWAL
jgi:hypothetical protein